jgi:hypothetical protein
MGLCLTFCVSQGVQLNPSQLALALVQLALALVQLALALVQLALALAQLAFAWLINNSLGLLSS